MGLFEPHGGHGRGDGQAEISPITVHGLEEAKAALDAARAEGRKAVLTTAPGASAYLGAACARALADAAAAYAPEALDYLIYDCGNRPGDVMAGLRAGLRHLRLDRLSCPPALEAYAALYGAVLYLD
jgi:fructose/tagatose bisphosphate aldolase